MLQQRRFLCGALSSESPVLKPLIHITCGLGAYVLLGFKPQQRRCRTAVSRVAVTGLQSVTVTGGLPAGTGEVKSVGVKTDYLRISDSPEAKSCCQTPSQTADETPPE